MYSVVAIGSGTGRGSDSKQTMERAIVYPNCIVCTSLIGWEGDYIVDLDYRDLSGADQFL